MLLAGCAGAAAVGRPPTAAPQPAPSASSCMPHQAARGMPAVLPSSVSAASRIHGCKGRRPVTHLQAAAVAATPTLTRPLQMRELGASGIKVSEVCLGTMTWGEQNSEAEAHWQMGFATEAGVNFMDTAEIYPVAPRPETANRTSTYIGNWLRSQPRDKFVIATKVTGRSPGMEWIVAHRSQPPAAGARSPVLDKTNIEAAVRAELRRLRTDHIDLLQLHWPDRWTPTFGRVQYLPDVAAAHEAQAAAAGRPVSSFEHIVEALAGLMQQGKVRAWGLSNETAWGVVRYCGAADALGAARPATIQNNYSLLNRSFEGPLAEACAPQHLNLGLLPWSALAGGALSGKYLGHGPDPARWPADWRLAKWPERYVRFTTPRVMAAVAEYARIAKEAGVTPAQLAYAWCRSRWFIPSTIIGATSEEQLRENLAAFALDLTPDTIAALEEVHLRMRDPALTD